ncbi:MAG: hypothetical protein ACI4UE_00945 [Candidatus Scatovivens sp.]
MKIILKKIISVILIIILLMPTFISTAEETIYEHEYKLEEYIKEYYGYSEITEEKLSNVHSLYVYEEGWRYLDYEDYNMINLNLDILPKLTNLTEIYINFSGLKTFDMNLISNLTKLEKLTLCTDSLREIKNLDSKELLKLTNLKEIRIETNNEGIKSIDLSTIIELENLKKLNIKSNSITNIVAKGNSKPSQKKLELEINCPIMEKIDIDSFQNIYSIKLNNNYYNEVKLKDIQLKNLSNLTELYILADTLSVEQIVNNINYDNFKELISLTFKLNSLESTTEELDLFEVFDIESFLELKNLELDIYDSKISKININKNIEKLENLKICSEITEITNLEKIENLKYLYIDANINTINLPETIVSFTADYCEKLVNIKLNESIEYVSLNYCTKIEKVEITENFKNIERLEVKNYDLRELILPEDTSKLKNLIDLNITGDVLSDINYPNSLQNLYINSKNEDLNIPEYLNELQYLKINAYNLKQLNLPEDTSKLKNLISLNITGDVLSDINYPNSLQNLYINSKNEDLNIPEYLNELQYLKINAYNLKQLNLPEDTSKLKNLISLNITGDVLSDINYPNSLQNLYINSENENLNIPEYLNKLEYLNIWTYNLKQLNLPEDTSKLENLIDLSIDGNVLNDINYPNSLQNLYIYSKNESLNIPEYLNKLKYLNLGTYNLKQLNLPEDTSKLENLIVLSIDGNVLNDINYPNSLQNLYINSENEDLNIPEYLSELQYLEINAYNLEQLNLPKDTSKLESLYALHIYCKSINDINYPNKIEKLYIGVSEPQNISIPEGLTELSNIKIEADESTIDIKNLANYDVDGAIIICKKIKGNCIDKLSNLKGLKIFTQEQFDTSLISKLNKLQYLCLNQNYKPDNIEDNSALLRYGKLPIYIGEMNGKEYLYGFSFYDGEKYDTKSIFKEKFDYSKIIEENQINNPDIKIVNENDEELKEDEIIGTCDKVKIYDGEELKFEYSILYYGDVDGDGKWTAIDSLAIIKNNFTKNGFSLEVPFTFSNELYEEAGRIISETGNIPGAMDALAIIKQSFGTYKINQYKNISK